MRDSSSLHFRNESLYGFHQTVRLYDECLDPRVHFKGAL